MFTEHLNETMRRFVNELKLNRQRKQAAAARGRAIDCMELEDRILLSASPIAPTWLVNKTVVGVQQTTTQTSKTVAADASGNHVAVWSSQNADGSWTVNAQRFNSAGAALGTQIQVSSKTSLSQQNATVSMNANGSFVITWTNDNGSDSLVDVYAKQFTVNPDGSVKSGAEFLVTSHTRDDQMNSSVAVNSSGGFVVTWSSQKEDGTGWAVYAERFDSSGNALRPGIQGRKPPTPTTSFTPAWRPTPLEISPSSGKARTATARASSGNGSTRRAIRWGRYSAPTRPSPATSRAPTSP